MSEWSCLDCKYLDKNKIEYSEERYCFRYGCQKHKSIVGWLAEKNKDRQLKEMGCGDFKKVLAIEQLSLF